MIHSHHSGMSTNDVYDQIEPSLRTFLGEDTAFDLDVRESPDGFVAIIELDREPDLRIRAFAEKLEERMAARGSIVSFEIRRGKVAPRSRGGLAAAAAEFDKVWRRIAAYRPPATGEASPSGLPVREFIYLDVQRLASFFAQSREGLTTLVSLTESGAHKDVNEEREPGKTIVLDVEKVRGETSVLHDHMYHLVEQELQSSILDATRLNCAEKGDIDSLRRARLCRVRGAATVHDYHRLAMLLKKYNELGEAIAYTSSVGERGSVSSGRASTTGKKSNVGEQIAKSDAKAIAQRMGLHIDDQFLKKLAMLTELFYGDSYEIQITPSGGNSRCLYRAILNKESLRVPAEKIRLLYGSPTISDWVLVGSVTHVTGDQPTPTLSGQSFETPVSEAGEHNPISFRRAFIQCFEAVNLLQQLALSNEGIIEVTVFPLAIYRDLKG